MMDTECLREETCFSPLNLSFLGGGFVWQLFRRLDKNVGKSKHKHRGRATTCLTSGRSLNVLLAVAQARIATISENQYLEKDHVLGRRSCHQRCGVSYPVYVRRYVRKTVGMATSARFSHCQGCEPHILWTSDRIRTRPGRVELPTFSSV